MTYSPYGGIVGRVITGRNMPNTNFTIKGDDFDALGCGLERPKSPISMVRPSQHKYSNSVIVA